MKRQRQCILWLCVLTVLLCISCGSGTGQAGERDLRISPELTYSGSMDLVCAEKFAVDYYEEGYALVTIAEDGRYLLVPEGQEVPEGLSEDIIPLVQPLDQIYLSASAVMDMFAALDAVDRVRFSSLKAEGWYIEEARAAMEDGDILYAGKYSAPDFERIVSEGCRLAIENTMIYHTPEVKEQLERFGIPEIGRAHV